MARFATYVFIDLGTTDIQLEPIEITKVSMIAVSGKALRNIKNEPKDDIIAESLVQREQYLERTPYGELDLEEMVDFLHKLTKPICLIAHNGLRFDFPLLNRDVFQHEEEFFKDVMCVDSMHLFYDILDPKNEKSSRADRMKGSFPWPGAYGCKNHFDLRNLYKRVMGYDRPFENARERNMAVMELVVELASEFLHWVKKNQVPCLEVALEVQNNRSPWLGVSWKVQKNPFSWLELPCEDQNCHEVTAWEL